MTDICNDLQRVAYVMFKNGWQSKDVAGLALMEIASLRAEIERLRLSLSETEDNTLLSYLADIRQKSGVGIKPMLSELADAIATALSEARATGRREGLSEAANVADAASKEWEADAALWHKEGMLKTAASSLMHSEGAAKVAAAIRAAMEKAE